MMKKYNTHIFNGKEFSKRILKEISSSKNLNKLELDIIWIGDNPESEIYIKHKVKTAGNLGIKTKVHKFPITVNTDSLLNLQRKLNLNPRVNGYFYQLPIPYSLDSFVLFSNINPNKDVDGLNPLNLGRVWQCGKGFIPATAAGVLEILEKGANLDVRGMNITIINDSAIVGKPLAGVLQNKGATISICNSKTKSIAEFTRIADILITATGKAGLITGDLIKKGVVAIDIGISRVKTVENGIEKVEIKGDVNFESCINKASFITPVPGGVGPVTIAMLLKNLILAAQR